MASGRKARVLGALLLAGLGCEAAVAQAVAPGVAQGVSEGPAQASSPNPVASASTEVVLPDVPAVDASVGESLIAAANTATATDATTATTTNPTMGGAAVTPAGVATPELGGDVTHPGTEPTQVPVPPLSPEQAAFRDGILAGTASLGDAERVAIEDFYAKRDFTPYWNTADLDTLVAALRAAPAQAMPTARYDAEGLAGLFSAAGEAPREVAATRAFLGYARDLDSGVLTPSAVDPEIAIAPIRLTPDALLGRLAAAPVGDVLAELAPDSPEYARLIAEKARLETLLTEDAWGAAVSGGPTLRAGETGARVGALRARLARMGYEAARPTSPEDIRPADTSPGDASAEATPIDADSLEAAGVAPETTPMDAGSEQIASTDRFDAALEAEVRAFQRDHGLNDDGVVGQHTLAQINASPRDRLGQVMVNLERLRWLNHDLGPRYVMVNIPDYSARVYENGTPVWTTKTVVGEARETRTTEFSEVMSYMVVNPTWNVPSSIAKRDLVPRLRRDPGVLARSNMQLMTRSGTVIDPRLIDWASLGDSFPFRIRQIPSDGNALGKVKFMFPNVHAIYMHDTPHREYFARDARAYSNGCIRVQDPDGFARLLLRDQVSDPEAAFDGWVAAGSEKTVKLTHPIAVNIVYRTVFVDDGGAIRYRDDVYGRDRAVLTALEAAGLDFPAAEG